MFLNDNFLKKDEKFHQNFPFLLLIFLKFVLNKFHQKQFNVDDVLNHVALI